MKLPNGAQATIEPRKVTDYCLNPEHDDGRHKAHLFQKILGMTLDDADTLLAALNHAAIHAEATLGKRDQYGQRYTIEFEFVGPAGTATIRSGWIIGTGDLVPRFVTCYIL